MVRKALGFLVGVAALSVALGIVGLLWPSIVDAQTPSASRTITPETVEPEGSLRVTITLTTRTVGKITETLPPGFSLDSDDPNPVTPGDIRYTITGQDVAFTFSNITEFSYAVRASSILGDDYSFEGSLRYLDDRSDLQDGGMVGGDTGVMVRMGGVDSTPTTTTPTMAPTFTPVPTVTLRPTSTPLLLTGIAASRAINPSRVAPDEQVVVTITTRGFTAGQIRETLPAGFSYDDADSSPITPDDVRVRSDGQDVVFTIRGTRQFSYKVRAASTVDAYTFSGSLTYLDSSDNPQGGIAVKGDDRVAVSPAGVSVERAINQDMVSPGSQVVVTITNSGFTAGQITETLPDGFSFDANVDGAVSPDDVRARTEGQDVIFTLRGTEQFSYKVMVSNVLGEHRFPFSNGVRYLDDDDNPQNGGPVTGEDTVTVRMMPTVDPTSTPTPDPTRRPSSSRRGGGGGGGGGGYAPPVVTATPMPTRAPSAAVPTIVPTPTPIIVPTVVPTMAPTPEPTAKPEPTAVPPTAIPTPRPTARVVVPTVVAPTKPPEPTAMPKPTAVPPTAAPPTEVPPTAMVEPTEPPAPTATIAPTVAPVTPVTPTDDGMPVWLIIVIIVIIVAVVIAAIGFYLMRMRR